MILKGIVFLCFGLSGLFLGSFGYILGVYLLTKIGLLAENTSAGLGFGIVATAPLCMLICLFYSFSYGRALSELSANNYLEWRFLWGYPLLILWLVGPLILFAVKKIFGPLQ